MEDGRISKRFRRRGEVEIGSLDRIVRLGRLGLEGALTDSWSIGLSGGFWDKYLKMDLDDTVGGYLRRKVGEIGVRC